ncbi:MAG: hypothetical protein NTV81_03560 [Candidatus Komeilibacteria bacterium]|nr:hypothetical protein [Candidatus Komeilibacteria bacterium]
MIIKSELVASEAVKAGWQKAKQHFWFFLQILVIILILYGFSQYIKDSTKQLPSLFASFIGILTWLIATGVSMGTTRLALRIFDGTSSSLKDWLDIELGQYLHYALNSIVLAIVPIIIGVIFSLWLVPIILGLLAGVKLSTIFIIVMVVLTVLVAWLVFWYYLSFQFAGLAIIDQKLKVIPALKYSLKITKGHKFNLFSLALLLFLVNLAGAICLGIGLLFTLPLSWVAIAYAYRFLSKEALGISKAIDSTIELPITSATV